MPPAAKRFAEIITFKCASAKPHLVLSWRSAVLTATNAGTVSRCMHNAGLIPSIDPAAANGGNCSLTSADQLIDYHGVRMIGSTTSASLEAAGFRRPERLQVAGTSDGR
jgi:NAD/NADP transhydrogenase alpha subunit